MRFFVGCFAFVVAACSPPASTLPFAGTLPAGAAVDMTGTFKLSPEGELRLALTQPCTMEHATTSNPSAVFNCDPQVLEQIHVTAHAPWGQDIPGTWNGPAYVVFKIDWGATGIDALADDATANASRPWTVSGTRWEPNAEQVAVMLKRIGEATGTETEIVRGGQPPNLEVTGFEIEGGALHVGDANTLVVKVANRGAGAAYRVVATTRSSIEGLHGKKLSFGTIKPGADKVRKLQLTVPASVDERDTMLVLGLSEGNGFAPRIVSHRIPITRPVTAAALSLRCSIVGRDGPRPEVGAGQNLMVRCQVDNKGNAEAKQVGLDAKIVGGAVGATGRTVTQPIPAAGHATIDVAITVPRDLPMDTPIEIAVTASDRSSSLTASTKVPGVVRKPKLCEPGTLTRAQYQAKITELRAAVAAGDITQAQLDRYDTELVACLK